MIETKRCTSIWRLASAVVALTAFRLTAGTMSASSDAPAVDGDDIANYGAATAADKWWPSEAGSYGNAGMTIGQTFTTGSGAVLLNAVTFRVRDATLPTKSYTIRVGEVSGTNFTELASESATQTIATADDDYWTWTFDTPVLLSPNTLYGVDVGLHSSTSEWQTGIPYVHYMSADAYSGGSRFRSGSDGYGVGDSTIVHVSGERVFHLDLERPAGQEFEFVAGYPLDDTEDALIPPHLVATFNKNLVLGNGTVTVRDLTDSNDTVIPTGDPRLIIDENLLMIETPGLIEWGKSYAIRIDRHAIESDEGDKYSGIADDTTWNFSTIAGDPLILALQALQDHINGVTALTATEIEAHRTTIMDSKDRLDESAATIQAAFDTVTAYDTVLGPLSINFDRRNPVNPEDSVDAQLDWTLFNLMQAIMDVVYTAESLAGHEALLDGFKFGCSSHFPGAVDAPVDPGNVHTATIDGSFPDTFGRDTQHWLWPARKPTGCYLAPGTIVTVTVPPALVNQGYQVRVGAHSWDHEAKNRPPIRRLSRATILYNLDATTVKVASPYGGGIYIEVPFGSDAGVIDVDITGAVRAPYFSAKSFHTTSLDEWLTVERNHPAPWADFQSEKFMMQVPRTWIYALDDPVTLMAEWDASIDVMNDLMGFPHLRGKETMYCQVDVILRSSVHAPGYPAVNQTYNPSHDYGGYAGSYLVRGPGNGAQTEVHEQGHAYFFPKFGGETESNVNLPYVAVLHRVFERDLGYALAASNGYGGNPGRTLDNAAIAWMCSFNFSPREVEMHSAEKAYQMKGHAKFADIARLFGWDGLGQFWYSMNLDEENGDPVPSSDDAKLVRLCQSVGQDIRPLFHFWGTFPDDAGALQAAVDAAGLTPSPRIYELLNYYQSLVPADNAEFQTYCLDWWGKQPNPLGYWTESEHGRQWDSTPWYEENNNTEQRPNGEIYVEASAADIRNRVQDIIDLYFPDGNPDPDYTSAPFPDPMAFAVPPIPGDAGSVVMTAVIATDIHTPVEYCFENITNGNLRDWSTDRSWNNEGLAGGRTYEYRVKARDALGNETEWSDVWAATVGGSNLFVDWIAGYDVGGQDGFNEDPDRDGNSSGAENYFGTDPTVFSKGLISTDWTVPWAGKWLFTHPLSNNPAADVAARYLWSKDMKTFYEDGETDSDGTTVSFNQSPPSQGTVVVEASFTGPMPTSLFVKLQVTQTPP